MNAHKVFLALALLACILLAAGAYWYTRPHVSTNVSAGGTTTALVVQQAGTASTLGTATLMEEIANYRLSYRVQESDKTHKYFVTNKKTGQEVALKSIENGRETISDEVVGGISTDSAGHYIAIDQGTDVTRAAVLFSLDSGKFVMDLCVHNKTFFWHEFLIYQSCNTDEALVKWEGGIPNILAINLATGATTTLAPSARDGAHYLYSGLMVVGNQLTYTEKKLFHGSDGQWVDDALNSESATLDLSASL